MKSRVFFFIILFVSSFSINGIAQVPERSFQWFDKSGNKVTTQDVFKAAAQADLECILFGELHDDVIAHWMQYELIDYLAGQRFIKIGMEMFEADVQHLVYEYFSSDITYSHFKNAARPWPNFENDYKPIFDFAAEYSIEFVATNIPRRYASYVYRNSLDSLHQLLSYNSPSWLPPSPIPFDASLPGYKPLVADGGLSFAQAQASKDAVMGYSISKRLKTNFVFVHINGSYHSDNYEGIYWYIKRYKPSASILTLSTKRQDDISALAEEHKGVADFILVTSSRFPKSY